MATQVQGLFGLSPEDIQAQQDALLQERARQFAQMDPMERANYGIFMGVNQLGSGIAQAMGYESPEMKAAKERQGLLSGMDITNPQALREAAQKAWNGGQHSIAQELLKQAQSLEAEQAQTNLRKAQADYWGKKDPTAVGGGGGEGKRSKEERMLDFISDIDRRYAVGEPVEPWEEAQAQNYASQLSAAKTYQDSEGRIVQVPGRVVNRLPRGGQKPETPSPSGQPAPSAKAGLTVYETPKSAEVKAKEVDAKEMTVQRLKDGVTNIDTALNTLGSLSTNPWVQGFAKAFPTDARTLQNAVSAINSTKTIDLITQMKQQSKTGATGFGSVTEKELDLLQSDIVKLDPQSKTIKEDLNRVRQRWESLITRIEASGGKMPDQPSAPPSGGSSNFESIVQRVMSDPRNQGKSRAQVEAALRARGIK